jgi:hypothetical protein
MYVGTLLLNVQYRGDFGLISEQVPGGGLSGAGAGLSTAALRRMGTTGTVLERGDGVLLSTPIRDVNLLFSTVVAGYGTKLHNLKVDLKDV